MPLQETLPWIDPLALARGVDASEHSWILLYSGNQTSYSGRYSILALKPQQDIQTSHFGEIAPLLSDDQACYDNAWFGYLGYGLKNDAESLAVDAPFHLNLPDAWLVRYGLVMVFDHEKESVDVWAQTREALTDIPAPIFHASPPAVLVSDLSSNMTKDIYLEQVSAIQQAILRGDLYQANLTRKFFGTIAMKQSPFEIFCALSEHSPACYSSYLKYGETHIISSSPEQFVQISADGAVSSRPIKGTAPRHDSREEDEAAREALIASEKDKAENLMIVDLMRNDFSRGATPGSVSVPSLYDITAYRTLYHMSSEVISQKRDDVSSLDFIRYCFPPGSMTGTPKIKAMELCSALEKSERGVYSGAIGWFGGNGAVDLSVVIRTLIIQGTYAEFQVGGAIVADSDPIAEWQETLTKARSIAAVLNIRPMDLALL